MSAKKSKQLTWMGSLRSARPKNSNTTNTAGDFLHRHRNPVIKKLAIIIGYVFLWLLASYLFYRRFPDNYRNPNFYAEDGRIFAQSLIGHGFWHSLATTFNGYYIWGIYLLHECARIVNSVFYGGQFADLPRSIALVSYGFLGFMATLPALLFRKRFPMAALLLVALLVTFVPLLGFDYAIIGTIGNLKFAFLYVAFLLLCYRHFMPEGSKKVYLVDLGILICAYTDITIYVLMPFALLRYIPKIRRQQLWSSLKDMLLKDRSLQSLVVLGAALLPQLYVIKTNGVPTAAGYLTNGFNFHRTIEIFVSRSYLYDVLSPVNKHLSDTIVVLLALALIAFAWRFARRYKQFLIFGVLAVFAGTFLFVVKRTGVSDYFSGYKGGGPDQFFYSQNWIFSFILVIGFAESVRRIKLPVVRFMVYGLAFLVVGLGLAPRADYYGVNVFMSQTVGSVYAVGKADCQTNKQTISLTTYPTKDWQYSGISRQQLCTPDVLNYQPVVVSLGLAPDGNSYLALGPNRVFTQKFTASDNNLNGLNVYFSTFAAKVHSPYTLELLDSSCKTTMFRAAVPTSSLKDNTYGNVSFPTIKDSANKTYCFSIVADKIPSDPLAVQLSAPGVYPAGSATVKGVSSDKDVVFQLHYK